MKNISFIYFLFLQNLFFNVIHLGEKPIERAFFLKNGPHNCLLIDIEEAYKVIARRLLVQSRTIDLLRQDAAEMRYYEQNAEVKELQFHPISKEFKAHFWLPKASIYRASHH